MRVAAAEYDLRAASFAGREWDPSTVQTYLADRERVSLDRVHAASTVQAGDRRENDAVHLNRATRAARDELRIAARDTGGLRWVCSACGVVFRSPRRRAEDARCATCRDEYADGVPDVQRRANRAWWSDRHAPWVDAAGRITTPCAGHMTGCPERLPLAGRKKWCSDRCRKRAIRAIGTAPGASGAASG